MPIVVTFLSISHSTYEYTTVIFHNIYLSDVRIPADENNFDWKNQNQKKKTQRFVSEITNKYK